MKFTLEAYHEVNGSRADLGGFPYSAGIIQRVIKDFEYNGLDKNQSIEEENQDGESYITYAYDENAHSFMFQAQVTELDFFLNLKYHSHVYISIEGDSVRRFLKYKNVEVVEQASNTIYILNLMAVDDSSVSILRGDEL